MDEVADPPLSGWAAREADLLERVEGSINWNALHAKRSQRANNVALTIVLVFSVITPVAVTLSHQQSDPALQGVFYAIAVGAPIIIAIVEGLRRVFHFEDHWHESHLMMETLLDMRRRYADTQVSHAVGSPTWIQNYLMFRDEQEAAFTTHRARLFELDKKSEEQLRNQLAKLPDNPGSSI